VKGKAATLLLAAFLFLAIRMVSARASPCLLPGDHVADEHDERHKTDRIKNGKGQPTPSEAVTVATGCVGS
jgi:hypothetical protein